MSKTGIDKRSVFITILFIWAGTLISFFVQYLGFTEANIVVIYILSVLLTARFTKGYFYGIVTSVISMLSFNFFFSDPGFSFNVYDTTYIFTFVVMMIASMIVSTLTSKLLHLTQLSNAREEQTRTLYHFTAALSQNSGLRHVAATAVKGLDDYLSGNTFCILYDPAEHQAVYIEGEKAETYQQVDVQQVERLIADRMVFPVTVADQTVCLLCLPDIQVSEQEKATLESIVMQITVAIERELLTAEKEAANAEAHQERFKSNLLRSISHDLRTPLAAIAGSAEILMHNIENEGDKQTARSIYEDVGWLTRLIENILNYTRIQEARVQARIRPEAVEEVVASAAGRIKKYYPDLNLSIHIPEHVLFVLMDAGLIEQVLINLLDNAAKHTKPGSMVELSVKECLDKVLFEVSDNGGGIPEAELTKVFERFETSMERPADARRGIGLGLAICKAIAELHGSEIVAENNDQGGAVFRFSLKKQED